MDSGVQSQNLESILKENNEILKKILNHFKKDKRSKVVEILTAALLALATVASAWSAYQSTLWSGVQTFRLADANKSGREGSENTIRAAQTRSFDGLLLIKYIEAYRNGDTSLSKFYYSRFHPMLRNATDEWLKTDPFNNESAPNSPFQMDSYKLDFDKISNEQRQKSAEFMAAALEANVTSDTYVLLTVLFASVLFFGGVAGTFDSSRMRNLTLIIAVILFLGTVVSLLNMPICNQ
jgi:hypothetical protein